MIATITEDVETAFGIYHSIPVNVNPNVPAFVVEPDFSNVANFSRFEWTINSVDSTLFLQNHFTVKKVSTNSFMIFITSVPGIARPCL